MRRSIRGACLAVLAATASADAADLFTSWKASEWRVLDEVRAGAFAHGVDDAPEQGSADINLEVLTSRLPVGGGAWYVPRLHLGTSISLDDDTSHVYGGVTWTVDVMEHVFLEASFGGGVHDGDTGATAAPGDNALGCSPLFRESASLGVRITGNWSVMATIEHLSNAGLCDSNRGITNAGGRIGYRF